MDGFVVDREKKTADASAVLPLHRRAHIQAVKRGTRGGKGDCQLTRRKQGRPFLTPNIVFTRRQSTPSKKVRLSPSLSLSLLRYSHIRYPSLSAYIDLSHSACQAGVLISLTVRPLDHSCVAKEAKKSHITHVTAITPGSQA